MRRSYVGQPALVCVAPLCPRRTWVRATRTNLGRTLVIVWLVLAAVGLVLTLTGCDPERSVDTPKPLQTGRQSPNPLVTVIEPK